ncbi:hypothetical protein CYY_000862 [Polysphondylium violaceum]|uniref:BolA family protein n=1 Tax=Polysphondylium violaceum TaxID=133409 RepID=A0A8J4Q411_9MYCE|nr:hypothetical protein CYY_000862 [Polysphondylium violaceum]
MSAADRPVENEIRQKLIKEYNPIHVEVINESHMHNVPKNSESHFKVLVVSDVFTPLSLIEQHKHINNTLADYIGTGKIHALSIVSRTPVQWDRIQKKKELEQQQQQSNSSLVDPSPSCKGGFGK